MDHLAQHNQPVFSTYVEVILKNARFRESQKGILHVCGGDPTSDYSNDIAC